jgi:hypothetical protein
VFLKESTKQTELNKIMFFGQIGSVFSTHTGWIIYYFNDKQRPDIPQICISCRVWGRLTFSEDSYAKCGGGGGGSDNKLYKV